jgi:hypothetical protein
VQLIAVAFLLFPAIFVYFRFAQKPFLISYFSVLSITLIVSLWISLFTSLSVSRAIVSILWVIYLIYSVLKSKSKLYSALKIRKLSRHITINYFLLVVSGLFILVVNLKNYGTFFPDWDAQSQHLAIVHEMIQADSIAKPREFTWAAGIPALSHYLTSVFYAILPGTLSLKLSSTLLFLSFQAITLNLVDCFTSKKMLNSKQVTFEFVNTNYWIVSAIKVIILLNFSVLIITSSIGIDFLTQIALLILFYSIFVCIKKGEIDSFNSFLIFSSGATILATKWVGMYQVAAIFLSAIFLLLFHNSIYKIFKSVAILISSIIFGSVFLVRNAYAFSNPFYPYSLPGLSPSINHIVNYASAKTGMEEANLPPSLVDANMLSIFSHYWFYSIYNFFQGMYKILLSVVSGSIPDGSFLTGFYSASVGMLGVSVVGIVFCILHIKKAKSSMLYQIYILLWLSWFIFPKATSPRFIFAYSIVIFLLSFQVSLKFWLTRAGKFVLSSLLIFAILSPVMAFISISRSQVPFYRNVGGNSDLISARCPNVVITENVPGTYLSLPGFSSAPLLDQMCTSLFENKEGAEKSQAVLYFNKFGMKDSIPACLLQRDFLLRTDKFEQAKYIFTTELC